MPWKIADLVKSKGGATKYRLHDVGIQLCCFVFIQMYLSNTVLLCLNWNVFNISTQMSSDYNVGMIYRNKMA